MQAIKRLLPGIDTMGLTLTMWLCTLPLIGFVIAPLFGKQAAISIAIGLLIIMLAVCWLSCVPKVVRAYREKRLLSSAAALKISGARNSARVLNVKPSDVQEK